MLFNAKIGRILTFLFFGFLQLWPFFAFSQQVDTAWVRRYNGPGNGDDKAVAIAVDSNGNVYVTGSSFDSSTGYDYCTIKYLPNGDTGWVRRYNGPDNLDDFSVGLTLDDSGNIYVTGKSTNNFQTFWGLSSDYATIKYAPNGDTLWVRRFNHFPFLSFSRGVAIDSAAALAVDKNGSIYVTGSSAPANDDVPLTHYQTIKYSPNGDTLWVRHYAGGSFDYAKDLVVDDKGGIYVTGSSWSGGLRSYYDYATIKYLPNGDTAWVRRYNGPANNDDIARAIAEDSSNNVYITGGSNGDILTIKYDSNGNQLWAQRYASVFVKLSEGGGYAIGLDGNLNVYVTGQVWDLESMAWFTIKYDSQGGQLWVKEIISRSPSFDLAVDTGGNVYVTSQSSGAYYTVKYDPQGSQLWSKSYYGPAYPAQPNAIALDPGGNVYVTGFSAGKGMGYDFATIKYSPLPQLKGDLNLDGVLDPYDVVLSLNCTFLGEVPPAAPAACDINCDGRVSPADVVILLLMVFSSATAPC